jgi:hypothetical protein
VFQYCVFVFGSVRAFLHNGFCWYAI